MVKWRKTQTDDGQADNLTANIVTSDTTTKHHVRRLSRRTGILLTSTILLLAVGATGWYVWHAVHTATPAGHSTIRALDPLSQVSVDATKAANTSGATDGDKIYEKAIASAKTDSDKFTLYMGKGALDYNAKEYDAALAAGLAAEKIHADYRAWGFLATVYDAKGDTKNAIIYYQKAANDNVEFNYDQAIYQQRYKELTNGS